MNENELFIAENKIKKIIPNYEKYLMAKEKLHNTPNSSEEYKAIFSTFTLLRLSVISSVKKYMFEQGFEVDFNLNDENSGDRAIMLLSLYLLPSYYNFKNIPKAMVNSIINDYDADFLNAYLSVFNYCKKGLIDNKHLYDIIYTCFVSIFDMMNKIHNENDAIGLINYISILDNFKSRDRTSIMLLPIIKNFEDISNQIDYTYNIFDFLGNDNDFLKLFTFDDRFCKYLLYLTSNSDFLAGLKPYDLYLILKYFNNEEFLSAFEQTGGKIVNDIAKIIIRRKKEGLSQEDEEVQLKSLSNHLKQIKSDCNVINL